MRTSWFGKLSILAAVVILGGTSAAFAASGCTSSSTTGGGTGGAFGGSTGGSTGGAAGGAQGGATGGAQGGASGGATGGAAGGSVGCPIFDTGNDGGPITYGSAPCDDCMKQNCCNQVTTCFSDPTGNCQALADCYAGCENTDGGLLDAGDVLTCEQGCDTVYASGVDAGQDIATCQQTSCATPCGL